MSTVRERPPLLIGEVILENFMSYSYAKIPFRPGLNVVCGPNGSGKSSILLGLSVALGQAYTERSRKLSDLIRWGQDIARVTIVFDNSPKEGGRPMPNHRSDQLIVSRYLKRDGTYWYEVNGHEVDKLDVQRLLQEHGISPDNLLIIMHQGMLEEFVVATPQQKLKMVEEAVGLRAYRERVLEARERLKSLLSEESSVSSLLTNAEQTLSHWKGEYERYLRKRELIERRDALEAELAWSKVVRKEKAILSLQDKVKRLAAKLDYMARKIEEAKTATEEADQKRGALAQEQKRQFFELLEFEKRKSEIETTSALFRDLLARFENEHQSNGALSKYFEEAGGRIKVMEGELKTLEGKISTVQGDIDKVEKRLNSLSGKYVDGRVREAVLTYRREDAEGDLRDAQRQIEEVQGDLDQLVEAAEAVGPRVESERDPVEVSEELKVTMAYLTSVGDISEDVEKMYRNYSQIHGELKDKLATLSENRKRALQEVENRLAAWKGMIRALLERVNPTYNEALSKMDAVGEVRLVEVDDVEKTGLEQYIGFRGAKPAMLDVYTQSGGERSVGVMAFMLALQRHIKSPFRAVDEFDVHMDPRNREAVYQFLMASMKGAGSQYLAITPSPVTFSDEDVHMITIQSISGSSMAKEVRKNA